MIKSTQFLHKVSKFNYHFHNLWYCWSFKVHFCLRQTSIIIRQRTTNFICFICFFLAINVLHFVLVCIETDSEQLKQDINMKSTCHANLRSWMKTQIMNYNKSVDWFSPCLHHGKQGKAPPFDPRWFNDFRATFSSLFMGSSVGVTQTEKAI